MLGWLMIEVRSVKKDCNGKVDEQSFEGVTDAHPRIRAGKMMEYWKNGHVVRS